MDNSGSADIPHHLIFGKILEKTPATATKLAVQLSFILFQQGSIEEDVVSSWASVLDLDEFDGPHQHDRFVKFLKGYSKYYRRNRYYRNMDTLKLNMRMNTREEYKILRRWLKLAFRKRVELKALHISCPPTDEPACSGLSWVTTFANAKFLTSLNLDGVKFKPFGKYIGTQGPGTIFPSLKTLSLKRLRLCNNDIFILLLPWTCPSIEYLSLTDFRFEKDKSCNIYTQSLKSFEFNFCEMPGNSFIKVTTKQANMTESFTWIGVPSDQLPQSLEWMTVLRIARMSLTCLNLQFVKIVKIQEGNERAFSINDGPLFPNMKTMSFTDIQESDDEDLLSILSGCPSLEYLSLTKCCGFKCHVSSSSIKSLEIKHCNQLQLIQIDDAENLESFTFHSPSQPSPEPICKKVILDNSLKLKNIDICVDDLVEFSLNGCQPVRSHLNLMDSFHKIASSARINISVHDG